MRILVLGAGAVGTYIGGSLAARGQSVAIVERPDVVDALRAGGLRLQRGSFARTVRDIEVFPSPSDALAAAEYDVCLLAVKSFDTQAAVQGLLDTGLAVPPILSLQNGVDNEATIARLLGADRVIAGTVLSALAKPGLGEVVEETHRGVGIATGHPVSQPLIDALGYAGITTVGYDDAWSMKWSKLLTNLQGNALAAILDMTVREVYADPRLFAVEMEALREALRVMDAVGARPVKLPKTDVPWLARATKLPAWFTRPILMRILGGSRGDKMPSMHIDVHVRHTRTEVRWLNGAVVRHGADAGVPTPVNAVITETLEAISADESLVARYARRPQALLERLRAS